MHVPRDKYLIANHVQPFFGFDRIPSSIPKRIALSSTHHASRNHYPDEHRGPGRLRNRPALDLHRRLHHVPPAPPLPPEPLRPNPHPAHLRRPRPPRHRLPLPPRQILRPAVPHAGRAARPRSRHPGRLLRHLARDREPRLHAEVESGARERFGFAFIDAGEVNNYRYFDWAVRMSVPGACICVDNVLCKGKLAMAEEAARNDMVRGARECVERVGGG